MKEIGKCPENTVSKIGCPQPHHHPLCSSEEAVALMGCVLLRTLNQGVRPWLSSLLLQAQYFFLCEYIIASVKTSRIVLGEAVLNLCTAYFTTYNMATFANVRLSTFESPPLGNWLVLRVTMTCQE